MAHVGCCATDTVGAAGKAGTLLTVNAKAGEMHPPLFFVVTL